MAESLDSTLKVYQRFLDLIKRESTSIVPPIVFNRLANDGQEEWLARVIGEVERDQKRMDDIRVLRIYPATIAISIINNVFPLPDGATINDVISNSLLPLYYRFLNVEFKITYINNDCGLTGISDWIKNVFVLRSDQKNWIMTSPHRKPNDAKIGYEFIGNTIMIETGTSSTGLQMKLDYVRVPLMFNYDNLIPANNVNFEFPNQQKAEIIREMVRMHLEKLKDERYRSWIQEEYIKTQNN